jgi:hypothetical protein
VVGDGVLGEVSQMKVSEYAKQEGISRQAVYYRIHHGLVPWYTHMGHFVIDWDTYLKEQEHRCDELFVLHLMGKLK